MLLMMTRDLFLRFTGRTALCALFGWLCGCGPPPEQRGGAGSPSVITSATLRVASWNVENLFDTEDDRNNPGDDEFTPNGTMQWTEHVYRMKLNRLAEIIAAMQPDILGLAEVENRRVLEDLQQTLATVYGYLLPEIVHREGNDSRGIEVALLSKYKPTDTRWLTGNPMGREMICSTFSTGASKLTLILCHWKSKLIPAGMTEQQVNTMRIREARVTRRAFEKVLRKNPGAAVMVMGDFNDDTASPILTEEGGLLASREALKANPLCLYNLSADIHPSRRGTYFYHPQKIWNPFDSISVSASMLSLGTSNTWKVQKGSYCIFKHPKHLNENNTPKSFRLFSSKEGESYYIYGYSDHFPVMVTLERR